MKLISTRCPHCDNPQLEISHGQKHCQCEYCGSKYVIDWSDSGDPKLSSFNSILRKAITNTQFLVADRRLYYIEGEITRARELVNDRRKQCHQAVAEHKALVTRRKRNCETAEMGFWSTVAAAVGAWVLVIFVLEGVVWYLFVLIGIGAVVAAIGLYSEWKKAEGRLQTVLRGGRPKVEQANKRLGEALNRLQDLLLEKELCTEKVRSHRYTELDDNLQAQ